MISFEVKSMDEMRENDNIRPEEGYAPRPRWQVWAARIGLALFILTLIAYYLNVFRGGL